MINISGFLNIPNLANNQKGVVADFGELSTKSLTFSRDITNYSKTESFKDVEFIGFRQVDENSSRITLPSAVSDLTLDIGNWIYSQYRVNQIPSNASKATFVTAIQEQFTSARNVRIGEILTGAATTNRMPDYVEFITSFNNKEWRVKFWISDASFRRQYPHYEIYAIPPVQNIEQLTNDTATVNLSLRNTDATYLVNSIKNIQGDDPFTDMLTYTLTWHDKDNFDSTIQMTWSLVIYGQAGIDTEITKDAIRSYISSNSTFDEWDLIYPDLYSENEFIYIPFWDKLAEVTNNADESLYSSAINVAEALTTAKSKIPSGYGQVEGQVDFVDSHLTFMSVYYRNLMIATIGNPNNSEGVSDFQQLFPDYIDSPTSNNGDFARMEVVTQRWVIKFNDTLNLARQIQDNQSLPEGYSRAVRNNRQYVVFEYLGFNHLVLTRQGFFKE